MTTTTQHHLPTITTPSDRHHHDFHHLTTHASMPRKPTPTDTCHLFEEAVEPAAATSC